MDNLDMLIECGFNIPVTKLVLSDKVNIIQTVTLHKVILASLGELSQVWVFLMLSKTILNYCLHSIVKAVMSP